MGGKGFPAHGKGAPALPAPGPVNAPPKAISAPPPVTAPGAMGAMAGFKGGKAPGKGTKGKAGSFCHLLEVKVNFNALLFRCEPCQILSGPTGWQRPCHGPGGMP